MCVLCFCTGKHGKGVAVYLHADGILQIMEQQKSNVCWIVIYKVGSRLSLLSFFYLTYFLTYFVIVCDWEAY